MRRPGKFPLAQAAISVLGLILWGCAPTLEGTEFSGGQVTGLLLKLYNVGTILFIVAFLTAFFLRRISAITSLVASLLCLPIYLYFVVPGPFRWAVKGEYSVAVRPNLVWNNWGVAGLAVLAMAVFAGIRCLFSIAERHYGSPGSCDYH